MICSDAYKKNNALDALEKIRVLLQAALFLNENAQERKASQELVGLAEDAAVRALEDFE